MPNAQRVPSQGGMHIEMPPYQPPLKHKSEKMGNDMYPFSQLDFGPRDVRRKFKGVTMPLSLFAPYSHEDAEPPPDVPELDRPVTPINDEIKAPPVSMNRLAKLVRRRIAAKPEVEHLSSEDQQALAAVIMGEVTAIWPDLRLQVSDPFLGVEDNKELQRRITVHIVTVCERLFYHYVQKAQVLNKRGIFSGPANTSRLKAQLALDAHKFLNVLTIRRHIVGDMRGRHDDSDSDEDTSPTQRRAPLPKQPTHPALSFKGLVQASRPLSSGRKQKISSMEEDLKEIRSNIPVLDTEKLLEVVTAIPQIHALAHTPGNALSSASKASLEVGSVKSEHSLKKIPSIPRKTSQDLSMEKVRLKRSTSVPKLDIGAGLLEELDSENEDETGRQSAISLNNQSVLNTERHQAKKPAKIVHKPAPDLIAEDLKMLMSRPTELEVMPGHDDEDLPPLIQAMTRSAKHDGKGPILKQQLKELEEREKQRQLDESVVIQEPTHPQPATVASKLPNKMVVKTSDVRVSERICLSSITLKKHDTVYNDLTDEIDPATVKHLDSNLFLGEEIREVYSEIMKTVHTNHLRLEDDDLIEETADDVNLTAAMASSTLGRKHSDRIINSVLKQTDQPPWAETGFEDWSKGLPPGGFRTQESGFGEQTGGDGREVGGDQFGQQPTHGDAQPRSDEMPTHMQDFMARSYASWLMWWKNTINSDDYMKYLSTQETDFMGVLFHFYNSDDEDADDDEGRASQAKKQASKQAMLEERERKLDELRAQKESFEPGMWNCNSILLGGLGKVPSLPEDEDMFIAPTPSVSEPPATVKTSYSRTKVMSRKSHKSLSVVGEMEEGNISNRTKDDSRSRSQVAFTPQTGISQSVLEAKHSVKSASKKGEELVEVAPQDRLERVWAKLYMPDNLKLDMAIKYSSDVYHKSILEAIERWEVVTSLILQREELIAQLETFERLASDPNRFFEKGYRGSSIARLDEAKMRSSIYKKLDDMEAELKPQLEGLNKDLEDSVTFQGRPYVDKMKWDRVEMLYWLQEERRVQALEHEARPSTQIALSRVQLEPINSPVASIVA